MGLLTPNSINADSKTAIRKQRLYDLFAIGLLAMAALIFFWPVVTNTGWIPKGGGDSVSFIYPMYHFAAQTFWEGSIPLWNPYQYAGQAFITDNQSGVFYLPNLLLFLIDPDFSYRAIEWLVILHVFFAGATTYICLRGLNLKQRLQRPSALIGALAFMFSGVFISHIGNLNLIAVAAWLPLIFLCLHRATEAEMHADKIAWALAGGVALGISTLAGHGQMTFLLAAFLGSYALYWTVIDRNGRPLLLLLLLALTGIGIAAISLFPALEAVQHTVRGGYDSANALNYALSWQGLTGLIAPDFFGRGKVDFWGDWSRVEYGYVGVLTLFLAATAVVTHRNRFTWFFILSGFLFLLLALGPNAPLYPFLLNILPVFPFQVPARFVLLLDFCLAVLAAVGMDMLLGKPRAMRSLLWGSGVVVLFMIGVLVRGYFGYVTAVPHHQQQMLRAISVFAILAAGSWLLIFLRAQKRISIMVFSIAAIIWLAIDLIGLGWHIEVDWNDPSPGFANDSPALEFLKSDPGLHRIDITTGAWQPNLAQLEKLYALRGVYNPLELANYAAYIGSVGYRGSPLYNLTGTKYLIGGKKNPPADTNIIVPVFEDENVIVYLNTLALPRVSVLYNTIIVPNHDVAFDIVHADDFDPQMHLVLEEGQPLAQEPGQATITILKYDPNEIAFEVTLDKPGYFLLTDIYHPDWQATIDGESADILVADYAFRAVALEQGTHTIEMGYEPAGWTIGVLVFGLTWLLVIGYFFWYWRQKRTSK